MLGVFPKIQKFAKIRRASAVLKLSKKRYFFAERLLRPAAFQVFEHDLVGGLNHRLTDVLLGFWLRFRFGLRLFFVRFRHWLFFLRLRIIERVDFDEAMKLAADEILQRRSFALQNVERPVSQSCGNVRYHLARYRAINVFHFEKICGRVSAAT